MGFMDLTRNAVCIRMGAVLASNPAPPGSLSYWVARKGPGGQHKQTCADCSGEGKSPTLRVFPRPASKLLSGAELHVH